MTEIKVEKRFRDEIVCWKVSAVGASPNTVLKPDVGITLIVKAEGGVQTLMGGKVSTIYGLFNKNDKKIIGGNKPYPSESISIDAVDQNSFFDAEWGLAGPNAVKCFDPDFGVDCTAIARGKYKFVIDNYYSFVSSMPYADNGVITKSSVRDYLRTEASAVILSRIAALAASCDMIEAQTKILACAEEIKSDLNKRFVANGLTIMDFVIDCFDYSPEHTRNRARLNSAKMSTEITINENRGRFSDADVLKKNVDAMMPFYLAQNPESKIVYKTNGKTFSTDERDNDCDDKKRGNADNYVVYCSECGTKHKKGTNFCSKCGAKLSK